MDISGQFTLVVVAIFTSYCIGVKLMMNHRWRNTFIYTIWFGMIGIFISLVIMILQFPKEFRSGMFNHIEMLNARNHDRIIHLRQSIKPECFKEQ